MAYVITQNTGSNPLSNQQPQSLFPTNYIQDPVVQQNFETLNKILAQIINSTKISPANIVFGPAFATGNVATQFSGTGIKTPGALQVQITTRGNPVRVKIAPFPYAQFNSLFALGLAGASVSSMNCQFGWYRMDSLGNKVTVGSATVGVTGAPTTFLEQRLALPAFEMDDQVPSGTYTYQFFLQLFTTNMVLNVSQINAVALELR